MATAAGTDGTTVQVCKVCDGPFRDPRTLACGHNFCKVCIEKTVQEGKVTCRKGDHVTELPAQGDIDSLPVYKMANVFTQKVDAAVERRKRPSKWECVQGGNGDKKTATKACPDCVINLCDTCAAKHVKAEESLKHKLFPISDYMFCNITGHGEMLIQSLCKNCETMCCPLCLVKDHQGAKHQVISINKAGKTVKERYRDMLKQITSSNIEGAIAKSIDSLLETSNKFDKEFKKSINSTRQKLKELLKELDNREETIGKQLKDNIKVLETMSRDLKDYTKSRDELKEHLTYLINQASDPEVVGSEKDLPAYDITTYKQTLQRSSIDMPDFTTRFRDIQTQLDKCKEDLNITSIKYNVDSLPKTHSFTVGNNVYGLAVDSARERVIVRRQDATEPISVYDFRGNNIKVLGKGVEGIASASNQSVAIDTKRDLLILPMAGGFLVTMDMNGEVKDKIKVADNYLFAAGYSEEDFYVTSTYSPHQVYLINSETKQKVSSFKPENQTKFNHPYNVCCGQFTHEGETKSVVFVSDYSNHCIKVLDLTGKLLHVYGKEGKSGQGEGEFCNHWAICTDPTGRIIVGDRGNTRVVSVWREGNQDKWLQLIDKTQLTYSGNLVLTHDCVSRKLFVMYSGNTELQVYTG